MSVIALAAVDPVKDVMRTVDASPPLHPKARERHADRDPGRARPGRHGALAARAHMCACSGAACFVSLTAHASRLTHSLTMSDTQSRTRDASPGRGSLRAPRPPPPVTRVRLFGGLCVSLSDESVRHRAKNQEPATPRLRCGM